MYLNMHLILTTCTRFCYQTIQDALSSASLGYHVMIYAEIFKRRDKKWKIK